MKLFLAIGACVLALLVAPSITTSIDSWNDAAERRRALELSERQYQFDQQRQWDAATYAGRVAGDYTWRLMAFFVAALGVMFATDAWRNRQRRVDEDRRLVYPDQRGMLPVARRQLEADDLAVLVERALEAYHAARIEEARRPIPPALLTYAPKFSNSVTGAEAARIPAAPFVVPSFAELLGQGKIGPDAGGRLQPLILGYGAEEAVTGDWRSLYSTGMGGLQGSGKTWGAVFLLTQSAISGGRLVICDPHAGDDDESLARRVEPLSSAFLCDIADDEKSILAALRLATDTLDRRKKGDKDRTPVIVAIDEWLSLRRGKLAEALPAFVEAMSTEGRKLNIHCMLLTQRADKEAIGDFRNTLASSYVFRLRADEARMLTGLRASALPDDTLQLAPGESYLLDTRGQLTRVKIPMMTPADVVSAGRLLTDAQPTMEAPWKHSGSTLETRETVSQSAKPQSASTARILGAFQGGSDISEIARDISQAASGRKYAEALIEINRVLREEYRAS